MSFHGIPVVLTASATSVAPGQVGTLTRNKRDFVLTLSSLHYRVDPIRLPNGLTITSQTITLNRKARSALLIDRNAGTVGANVSWLVDAPNTRYNGSHTIVLPDRGQRQFLSFKKLSSGRYGFTIRSNWHGSVTLRHWKVAGKTVPGGPVAMSGVWTEHFVLTLKH